MRKRIFALIMAALAAAALTAMPAFAADGDGETDEWLSDWEYDVRLKWPDSGLDYHAVYLKKYIGESGDVKIHGGATVNGETDVPVFIDGEYDSEKKQYVNALQKSDGIVNLSFQNDGTKYGIPVCNFDSDCLDDFFRGMKNLKSVDLRTGIQLSPLSAENMFRDCKKLETVKMQEIGPYYPGFGRCTVFKSMFEGCTSLEEIDVICPKGQTYDDMFKGCVSLKSATVRSSGLDDSDLAYVTMDGMFDGCASLESADLSGMDTSGCADMSRMFRGCRGLGYFDFNLLDMSGATSLSDMFSGCSSLEAADLSGTSWNPGIRYATNMFRGCTSLTEITVPEDFEVPASCSGMFYVPSMARLTVKGKPSESFKSNCMSKFQEMNRYIGTITARAAVELSGRDLEDGRYIYSLAVQDVEKADQTNSGGAVEFTGIPVYAPGNLEIGIWERLYKPGETGSARYVEIGDDPHYGLSAHSLDYKRATVKITLNEDGTLSNGGVIHNEGAGRYIP